MGVGRVLAVTLCIVLAACANVGTPIEDEPVAGAPTAEVVEFTTEDGVNLSGFLFGSGETSVVLGHMRGSTKEAWTDVAVAVANNDMSAFVFDFRGYGGQEGEKDTNLVEDLTAAVNAARNEGAAKIIVGGASMGATAAVAVAAQEKVDGLIAVSPPAEFNGIDALELAPEVDVPAVFLAATGDEPYFSDARKLAKAADGRFVEYGGEAHGTDLFTEVGAAPTALVIRFAKDPAAEAAAK